MLPRTLGEWGGDKYIEPQKSLKRDSTWGRCVPAGPGEVGVEAAEALRKWCEGHTWNEGAQVRAFQAEGTTSTKE